MGLIPETQLSIIIIIILKIAVTGSEHNTYIQVLCQLWIISLIPLKPTDKGFPMST